MIDETPPQFDCIIANPPYFKLNADDPRVRASRTLVGTHTNIYTLFMALAMDSLMPQGKCVFIVPRSFCSGAYFARFREEFADRVTIENLHLFESRGANFDEVLQENVIVTFRKRELQAVPSETIAISVSQNGADIAHVESRPVPASLIMHRRERALFYRLPTTPDPEGVRCVERVAAPIRYGSLDWARGRFSCGTASAELSG